MVLRAQGREDSSNGQLAVFTLSFNEDLRQWLGTIAVEDVYAYSTNTNTCLGRIVLQQIIVQYIPQYGRGY